MINRSVVVLEGNIFCQVLRDYYPWWFLLYIHFLENIVCATLLILKMGDYNQTFTDSGPQCYVLQEAKMF